jgi:hypothetical protein
VTAGTRIDGVVAAGTAAAGAGVGAGEVAIVAGAPHAPRATDARTSSDDSDFIDDSV